jgi:hypothetical protein
MVTFLLYWFFLRIVAATEAFVGGMVWDFFVADFQISNIGQ